LPKSMHSPEPCLLEKTRWHPYSLQCLTTEKFIQVVNRILRGEYTLVRFNKTKETERVFGLTDSQQESPPDGAEKSEITDS